MAEPISRFPLQWPTGWPRMEAEFRTSARFNRKDRVSQTHRRDDGTTYDTSLARTRVLSVADATGRVRAELAHMGVDDGDVCISTNVELRLDGLPRSGRSEPADPGVAVYWLDRARLNTPPRCMAVDRYDRVADNLAAVAATLEAMRAIERHGGAEILDRAFAGFLALPPPFDWRAVLGFDRADNPSWAEVDARYRVLAGKLHPDRGGFHDAMADLNAAREAAREAVKP